MKKIGLFALGVVIVFCLFLGLTSAKEEPKVSNGKGTDVRKIAWGHIPKAESPHIVGSWKDGKVIKRKLERFNNKEVYIVSFPTNDNPSLGDYIIYIDINSKRFLGIGLRD